MYGVMKRGYPGNILATLPPGGLFFTDQFKMGGRNVTLDSLEQKKLLDTYGRDARSP